MTRPARAFLAAVLAGAVSLVLTAAAPGATPATLQIPATGHEVEGLERILPAFALLLVLAGGGIYFAKNGLPWRGARNAVDRKLKIAEMRSLGNRQFLVVVEYEETKLLLGVMPGKIDYLCGLDGRPGGPGDFASLVPTATTPEAIQ